MRAKANPAMTDPKSFTSNINWPTAIRFGVGRIRELAEACNAAGIARPLLVTDPGLAKLPMMKKIVVLCAEAGLGTTMFFDIRPNPVEQNIYDGLKTLKAGDHDGVVAIGGGSALDAGKIIAFMAGQTRPMWDFEDIGDWWTRADAKGILPIVAVPTTAGTGSEVGRAAVVTHVASHTKKILFHPKMMPRVVICDPELTIGLPPKITAGTGMDAFAHCLEAYCVPSFHPYADGVAIEGVRLIKEFLPRAVADGADIEARAYMMAAAGMGATAFQKGLGAIHSLSHPVGAVHDTHHGMTNAVVMPYVLRFNRPAIEPKIVRLARYIGLADASFEGFVDWVLALRKEIAIPHTLKDLGMSEGEIDRFAEMAAVDPTAGTNPVKIGVPQLKSLYAACLEGRL